MKRPNLTLALILFRAVGIAPASAITWTTLDFPGSFQTVAQGIDGNNVVGEYRTFDDSDSQEKLRGFHYDGSTWTTLAYPGALREETFGLNIDGTNIIGAYQFDSIHTYTFLYDGTTWATITRPGANVWATGIDANNLVGLYFNSSSGDRIFLYDGETWTVFNAPGATSTYAADIDAGNIVGSYFLAGESGFHGFLYDGTDWTTLDYPGATVLSTSALGIDGTNIVGSYQLDQEEFATHGFLYDGTTWTSLDYPGATDTVVTSISGNRIVGYYYDSEFAQHGFVATIPEPSTLGLLSLAASLILLWERRRVAHSSKLASSIGNQCQLSPVLRLFLRSGDILGLQFGRNSESLFCLNQ